MKILVTGGAGQLGRALGRCGAIALDRHALDITQPACVAAALDAHLPDVVINAAAYTAVDRAESERERAFAANAAGAEAVARACAARGIRLLHVSTDYVFDGSAREPYDEKAAAAPLGVYGESKLAGEHAVLSHDGVVVRTAWLFGPHAPSFVHAILRLASEQPVLRVVADQVGSPTCADDLAAQLIVLAGRPGTRGVYHACGTPGVSRHDFAMAILGEALRHRAIACTRVEPITSAEYPTPARRPAYAVLETGRLAALGIAPRTWHASLRRVVAQILGGTS